MPIVEAIGLEKRFGSTKALAGLDLEIEAGTVLGVLGPNGAGKTTAVRVLTTLISPDAGRAFVDGIDVTVDPAAVRARIGLTGQYAAIDERLTARENLELVGRFFRMSATRARQRAAELLTGFNLDEDADRVVKGFSGGMRRRIDIAMSLVARPKVLFLDEPTTGLDPVSRLGMWDLISELVAQGTTTLLTTQYLDEVDRLASTIMVVDRGTAIAKGTSQELKAQLGGVNASITLQDDSDPSAAARAIAPFAVDGTTSSREGRIMSLNVRPDTTTPVLVRALDEADVGISDVTLERPSLDDVFLALTGHTTASDDVKGSVR